MNVRRICALLVTALMLFSLLPANTLSVAAETKPTLTVEKVEASPGDEVNVAVSVSNNPGILSMTLNLEYDSGLTLLKGEKGEAFSTLEMTRPGKYQSPCNFLFSGTSIDVDQIFDGDVLNLKFKVDDDAAAGSIFEVSVSCEDTIDNDLQAIDVDVVDGYVSIDDYLPGDLSGDKKVNTTDAVLMKRYIAGGYDIEINEAAADVNADWRINTMDIVLLQRYIVGGYGVKLSRRGYQEVTEPHELQKVEFKAATCTEPGNSGYWYCSECDKYYSDEQGFTEIAYDQIVIDPFGHTVVVDPAVEPSGTTPGLTEGSHCSICGTVIVAQEEWSPNTYTIKYNIANGDEYLKKLDIPNNEANKTTLVEGESLYLQDIEVDGYRFLGWYDGASNNSNRITKIENADHSMTLYAHWEALQQVVEFKSDLVNVEPIHYDINESVILPTLTLDGYTFVGWTDYDGKKYTRIKQGTIGPVTLYANWISDRNQAWAKKKLDDPFIYEDDDTILFAYEIGEIRNVPVYEIENFGKINSDGVELTKTVSYSTTTTESLMNSYTRTVQDATTDSSSWTLSDDWTDSVEVTDEYCQQNGFTREEAETRSKSDSGTWYASTSTGGSSSTTVSDSTDSYNLHTETNNTRSWSDDYEERVSHGKETRKYDTHSKTRGGELNVGYKIKKSAGAEIPEVIKAKQDREFSIGGSLDYHWTDTNGKETTKRGDDKTTFKGSVSDTGSNDQTGMVSNHSSSSTNTSTWNSENGYSKSSSTSKSETIATALSEMISKKTGYGHTYIKSGGESTTQGLSHSSSSSEENASSVTWSTLTSNEVSETIRTTNTKAGYHRWVMAGTAHVFGVVGYDIATQTYFVYSYSIMDDDLYRFEDYSYDTAAYNDNQTGVIPFEIPYEVADHVNNRVFRTDGLEFDKNGNVTDYSGDDSFVYIPDYALVDNLIGKPSVIKVTGIASDAFNSKKDSLSGIRLSRFIEEVPDNAFKDCGELWEVHSSATVIGDNAFSGCPLIKNWDISSGVTSIGSNAFGSAETLTVMAANSGIVDGALSSGAKTITIGLECLSDSLDNKTLEAPAGTEDFYLNGYEKTFNGLKVVSHAQKTVLNSVNIVGAGEIPLKIDSPEVRFNQCNISNSGICAALTADATTLDLYGPTNITSAGQNALLARNLTTQKTIPGLKTELNITGDLVTCNAVNDPGYIKFKDGIGQIRTVDAETFEKLLHSYTLTFDPNGGSCDITSVEVANGTEIGTLPVPTREGFDFKGWKTASGEVLAEDTVFSDGEDRTVLAEWEAKKFTVAWNNVNGCTIKVERISSPNKNANTGVLTNGADIYYGDVLKATYTPNTGFSLKSNGDTNITVNGNVTAENIYANVQPYSYKASWTQGTGYTISVSRTSSPNGNAGTGTISSGATVYYGDVLKVTYSAKTGYTLGNTGEQNITVKSNVGSDKIFASATANSYTYNIVYKSNNGTSLGTSTATYKYGTSNTITAPAKTGYSTPASQTVAWDSTTAKTITFKYAPTSVATSKKVAGGNWWQSDASHGIDYRVDAEYRNRTSNSVEIRIKWTNSIKANTYYKYKQAFNANIGGVTTGDYQIVASGTWASSSSSARSASAYSAWKKVTVGATATSVHLEGWMWSEPLNSGLTSKGWSGTMSIPTY